MCGLREAGCLTCPTLSQVTNLASSLETPNKSTITTMAITFSLPVMTLTNFGHNRIVTISSVVLGPHNISNHLKTRVDSFLWEQLASINSSSLPISPVLSSACINNSISSHLSNTVSSRLSITILEALVDPWEVSSNSGNLRCR